MKVILIPIFKLFVLIFSIGLDIVRYILFVLFHTRLPQERYLFMSDKPDELSNDINWKLINIFDIKHWY